MGRQPFLLVQTGWAYLKGLLLVSLFSIVLLAATATGQDYILDELVVSVRPGASISLLAYQYGFIPLERLEGTGIWRVRTLGSLLEILMRVRADDSVEFAQLNYILGAPEAEQESMAFLDHGTPPFVDKASPAPYFDQPAGSKLRLRQAHKFTTGQDVIVAVVDTGTSFTHPALKDRTLAGWDFVDGDSDPADEPGGIGYGHGTFISGIIALVAPDARILPLRALNPAGRGDTFTVAKAIRYGADRGAAVINLSLGLSQPALVIEAMIAYAAQMQVVMVASAGNKNTNTPQYPAASPYVLGVAGANNRDIKASFSNFNERLGVSAPGVDVYSTFPNGQFAYWSGTSFSAAFVSGEAALVRALYPKDSAAAIQETIKQLSEDIYPLNPNYMGELGLGRINCLMVARPR